MKPIVLITGASGDIGAAAAQRFAEHGYAVVLQYHTKPERAQAVASAFPSDTPYLCVCCDLNDADSVAHMQREVHERLGSISVLINCAGIALPEKLLSDTTEEELLRVTETNVYGMIRVTKSFSDDLRLHRGAIVNLSSIWGVAGASCEVLYSMSKAAVVGFTKSLAKELGPSGVRVNCVAPGWIDTQMTAHLPKEARQAFIEDTLLGRIGTPQDVAEAILFLAEASFITGQTLVCDGGYTL